LQQLSVEDSVQNNRISSNLVRRIAIIHADQAKNGQPLGVPLNKEAVVLLRNQLDNHPKYVFTFRGKPVKKCNTRAWRKALIKAGISDFRWHDLRQTWASWHVQNGTPLHALQELGGRAAGRTSGWSSGMPIWHRNICRYMPTGCASSGKWWLQNRLHTPPESKNRLPDNAISD
jgi:hypothetical protein